MNVCVCVCVCVSCDCPQVMDSHKQPHVIKPHILSVNKICWVQPLIAQCIVVCRAQKEISKARIMLASLDVCVSCARLGLFFNVGIMSLQPCMGKV